MTQKRTHIEEKIDKIPVVKDSMIVLCAFLIATKSKDLECDMTVDGKQFHIEISEVNQDLE